ncbi:response regulator transcription factor [Robiginitalea sp. SC105]|uniref:response regulator transcription factor n=1 Tax=Robiginitalea sp. SC105 TaxID=2762332 RepID=UPI00163A5F9E|nr:response regulator transcription factor [Robiginitalea sp. SC105]MBC2840415.1 response regulator transcription factor [Robiginitalea sp. SC105]
MKTTTLKVMVIDSDSRFLEAYPYYFNTYRDYDLAGIYTTVAEALEDYPLVQPDIVLSEVHLPEGCGVAGIAEFRKRDSDARVIMVSDETDFETIKKAFKYGAVGYLTKPVSKKRLEQALDSIKYEGAALSHDIAKQVISMFRRKQYTNFSERENEIIECLGQGMTYKSIAEKLFVTTSTINFHIQNIYLKLDVNSKSEALQKIRQLESA